MTKRSSRITNLLKRKLESHPKQKENPKCPQTLVLHSFFLGGAGIAASMLGSAGIAATLGGAGVASALGGAGIAATLGGAGVTTALGGTGVTGCDLDAARVRNIGGGGRQGCGRGG
jgi:hypothetical protein